MCWIENPDGILQISGIPHKRRQIKGGEVGQMWAPRVNGNLKMRLWWTGTVKCPPRRPPSQAAPTPLPGWGRVTPHRMAYPSFHWANSSAGNARVLSSEIRASRGRQCDPHVWTNRAARIFLGRAKGRGKTIPQPGAVFNLVAKVLVVSGRRSRR